MTPYDRLAQLGLTLPPPPKPCGRTGAAQLAQQSRGDRVSARSAFLRAGEYYRQAAWFLRENLDDPRVLQAADDLRSRFRQASLQKQVGSAPDGPAREAEEHHLDSFAPEVFRQGLRTLPGRDHRLSGRSGG